MAVVVLCAGHAVPIQSCRLHENKKALEKRALIWWSFGIRILHFFPVSGFFGKIGFFGMITKLAA